MRVWDVPPKELCRKHLLGEHRELHGLWNILTKHGGKGGYSHHPETVRWVGKTRALYLRHEALVAEMLRRSYTHHSPLDTKLAKGKRTQDTFINTLKEQRALLKAKPCDCFISPHAGPSPWFVYILECNDGSLYTGVTTDVERRFKEHQAGMRARYTRAHGAKKVLYQEHYPNRSLAQVREAELKKLSRTEKLRLIERYAPLALFQKVG